MFVKEGVLHFHVRMILERSVMYLYRLIGGQVGSCLDELQLCKELNFRYSWSMEYMRQIAWCTTLQTEGTGEYWRYSLVQSSASWSCLECMHHLYMDSEMLGRTEGTVWFSDSVIHPTEAVHLQEKSLDWLHLTSPCLLYNHGCGCKVHWSWCFTGEG